MNDTAEALLLLNRAAGTQDADRLAGALHAALERRLPAALVRVDDHPAAADAAERFVRRQPRALVVDADLAA